MTAKERTEIEAKISELKGQMKDVHGSPCEVFSRVCGYLTRVQGWNAGKKEEFALRKKFKAKCCGEN